MNVHKRHVFGLTFPTNVQVLSKYVCVCAINPQIMGPADHELKLWAKISLPSSEDIFVTAKESYHTGLQGHCSGWGLGHLTVV